MNSLRRAYKGTKKFFSKYGRKALGLPPKQKRKAVSSLNVAEAISSLKECEICRAKDNWLEDMRIAAFLIEEARKQGVALWKLPSYSGLRFGCSQSHDSSFVSWILKRAAGEGISAKKEVTQRPGQNTYEFNPDEFEAPAAAHMLQLSSVAHCKPGLAYLGKRGVTLEFIESRKNEIIIPRAALGPRVISKDRMEASAISSANDAKIDWPFPIDLVYTWVDSSDEIWKSDFKSVEHEVEAYSGMKASTNAARWYSRDELRYSIRSVEMYAPWIRNIYVVTNRQVPAWLQQDERVKVVAHRDLYPDPSVLPTFNSNNIETVLHRIDGLAEHFIYFNDDIFFASPSSPEDFFTEGGASKIFFSNRHYDDRPVQDLDRPVIAAHKNTGALLKAHFGVPCHKKFKHAPYPMRRSIWDEIDGIWGTELAESRKHRFRSKFDIAGPYLYEYYAMLTARAFSAGIGYGYFDMQDPKLTAKVAASEAKGMRVFCLNDSDVPDGLVHAADLFVAKFLNSRFPVQTKWEKSPPATLNFEASSDFEADLRDAGPAEAERQYRAAIEGDRRAPEGRKLFTLLYQQGRYDEAADLATHIFWGDDSPYLKRLDALTRTERRPAELSGMIDRSSKKEFIRSLNLVVRTVVDEKAFEEFEAIVNSGEPEWRDDIDTRRAVGAAARRAGLGKKGVEIFARMLTDTAVPAKPPKKDTRRDFQTMKDPTLVLRDFYEVAGDLGSEIFLDAGTLLGCIREGNFIGYDADIDLGTRSAEAHAELARRMSADWRFNLSSTRTPDLLIQAKHVNGTNLDVLLHKWTPEKNKWVKQSHVYAWAFDDYQLESKEFVGLTVKVPSPPIPYLTQMYGETWNVPIAGFDSRLFAPNCFFPDEDEIISTVLNKARLAARVADRETVLKHKQFLLEKFNYIMPLPKGM